MDGLDRQLLNQVQTSFPVEARPYLILAKLTNSTEQEAWQRVQALRQQGIIRRLGGVFDSHRLGYKSTLCAAKVPEDKIQPLADLLLSIPGVTHNYLRNHNYNMWFTLIAPSLHEVEKILNQVKEVLGSGEVYSLPATRLFKISVDFDFNAEKEGLDTDSLQEQDRENEQVFSPGAWSNGKKPEPYPVDEKDKAIIRVLQGDLPSTLTPFTDLARELGWEERVLLARTEKLLNCGIIRRFGAVLRHQRAGFTANAMGVWQVPEEKVEEIGKVMASFREVSHCYQRPTLPDWPFNLFTMIHGRSIKGCQVVMERISKATGIEDYNMLFSQKELKKSSMQYFV
jgi:siroheme decarboxylase